MKMMRLLFSSFKWIICYLSEMAPHTTMNFEESLFEMHKNQSTGLVNIGHFLAVSWISF